MYIHTYRFLAKLLFVFLQSFVLILVLPRNEGL